MKQTFITGFILCFFLSVLSFNTSAQDYKYDISKYYTPDIVRNQLDLSFVNYGSLSSQVSSSDSTYSNNLSGTVNPAFSMYKNTRNVVSLFQLSGQLDGNWSSTGNLNKDNLYQYFSSSDNLNLNYNIKFYNINKHFWALQATGNFIVNINNTSSKSNSIISNKSDNSYSTNFQPTIGIGVGRIEQVTDARQAIYILEALYKKGVLSRKLDNKEVFQFAQIISKVKNKRFLDARLHLIDEISTVDSFFVDNNYLTKSNATYFSTLYDYWQNGALYNRSSGQTFEIDFSPNISWNNDRYLPVDTIFWQRNNQLQYQGTLAFKYSYEKPFDLNWQHSANASINCYSTLSYQNSTSGVNSPENLKRVFQGGAVFYGSYVISYYPNTRTNFNTNIYQSMSQNYYKDLTDVNSKLINYFTSYSNLSLSANYYFSTQLRISGGAGIGCNLQRQENNDNTFFRTSYSVSMIYSFF